MRSKRKLSWADVHEATFEMVRELVGRHTAGNLPFVYGVPRGGNYIAAILAGMGFPVTDKLQEAEVIVDDIVDSGRTRERYLEQAHGALFLAAYQQEDDWLVFPWETDEQEGGEDNVVRILQAVGEDPTRDGLLETPGRYIRAMRDLTCGYGDDPATILSKQFTEPHDAMIVLKQVPFWSLCEHHLLPFSGVAHIGYIPSAKRGTVVGLSKLARLLDCFARRLQVQERLTDQVTRALMEHLDASGAACIIEGTHLCMAMRGVGKAGVMTTSSLLGAMRTPEVRAEFLRLIGK